MDGRETLAGILYEKLKVKQSEYNEQQNTSLGNPKFVFVLEFVFYNLQYIYFKESIHTEYLLTKNVASILLSLSLWFYNVALQLLNLTLTWWFIASVKFERDENYFLKFNFCFKP